MRNDLVKYTEKILKYFGLRMPVVLSSDFFLELDDYSEMPMYLAIQDPNHKMNREEYLLDVAQCRLFDRMKLGISYELFALLHEIGHIMSEQTNFDEYQEDIDTLTALYDAGNLTALEYIFQYNSLENEANATDWALNWLKSNKELAKWWDLEYKFHYKDVFR